MDADAQMPGADLANEPTLAFGPFRFLKQRKTLFRGAAACPLGGRASDILTLLLERAGELVTKEELFAHAWPGAQVEEINLRVHVAALRKRLGDARDGMRYIVTLPGRGYCFTAPVMRINYQGGKPALAKPPTLPPRQATVIGRDGALAALGELLEGRRFITITGPGGMGKTTVGLEVARALAARYDGGVHFVALAPVSDAALVPTALAAALGLSITVGDPLPRLMAWLQGKSMLVVLDNCEHLATAAALLAEAMLRASPGLHILATSREALRAEGEWVYRLDPMATPRHAERVTAAQALDFPAIRLFADRAAAGSPAFVLNDGNVAEIAALCRRLDGLPLAIELAAARVNVLGTQELAARFDDQLLLFSEDRSAPESRHQTLHATIAWSYGLLTFREQAVLRAVSIYKSSFDLADATSISAQAAPLVIESLCEKSLIKYEVDGDLVRYRLLDSTRAFALRKAVDAGEWPALSRLHVQRFLQRSGAAEADWDSMASRDWLARYRPMVDDLRAALRWTLEEDDGRDAVALAAAGIPLWMHLSLIDECRDWVSKVLELQGAPAQTRAQMQQRMKLLHALGISAFYTKGMGPGLARVLNEARGLAEALDDVDYHLRILWGIFLIALVAGDYPEALKRAETFRERARFSANPQDLKAGERLVGTALYQLGRLREARLHVEGMLTDYIVPARRSDLVRFQYDQRVAARVPLSSILWLQGFPEQAMDNARRAVEEAQSIDHAVSLSYALSMSACPTALLAGDLAAARTFVDLLEYNSAINGLAPGAAWARYFNSVLDARRGNLLAGLRGAEAALTEMRASGLGLRYTAFLNEYAGLLCRAGRIDDGLSMIDTALQRCYRHQEGWVLAEVQRTKGELLWAAGNLPAAEALFVEALDRAEADEMQGWALRAAISLAGVKAARGEAAGGRLRLARVYERFAEGFATGDMLAAAALLRPDTGRG